MPVYMIQAGGEDGHVKIGSALKPEKRILELQTGNSARLRIIRLFDGGRAEEVRLHAEFASYRISISGEWFSFVPRMLSEDFGMAELPFTNQPKRTRAAPLSVSQRKQLSRDRRSFRTIELGPEAFEALEILREGSGDKSLTATAVRCLLEEAAAQKAAAGRRCQPGGYCDPADGEAG